MSEPITHAKFAKLKAKLEQQPAEPVKTEEPPFDVELGDVSVSIENNTDVEETDDE